ncbi:MAG: TlpA disulfide reductase family protein [Daejeonella sp.]
MQKYLFASLLFLLILPVFSQAQVKLITVDQLESRFANGKDTVYVVNFWATWCSPCVAEMPNFEKLQASYSSEPLKVLMISVDFKSKLQSAVIPFVKKKKFANEVFLLDEKSQQVYIDRISKDWSGALPATMFVNKNTRKIYEQEFSYDQLESVYKSSK